MKAVWIALMATALLTACATPSPVRVSNGDRSQGMVTLSYDYNVTQKPSINWRQGLQEAVARCQQWGYGTAIPTDKTSKTCTAKTQGGDCIAWRLSTDFQCTAKTQQQQ